MNNLFNIKDYVVVITGGTGVLGRSIAKYLALEGAKVIIGGRKEDVGAQIVSDITAAGGACEFVKMDVMNQQQIQEVCDLFDNPAYNYMLFYNLPFKNRNEELNDYYSRCDVMRNYIIGRIQSFY